MKNFLTIVLFLSIIELCSAQTRVKFDYDSAGNQKRRYVCINCSAREVTNDTITNADRVASQDVKLDDLDNVSYYPNPVQEELNINWINHDNKSLSTIEVSTLSGQVLSNYSNLNELNSTIVPFSGYSQGYYNVVLIFADGSKKSIKIVKK